tara:strand:+ start:2934 stop:3221 length:288 start_codon:yes stop_codon:yes gene_type:complete
MVLPGTLIPSPLRIFRNIGDDSVEETLRAMHLANTVDNTYEWGLGWIRTVLVSFAAVMSVSAMEANSDWNLWELTVEWLYQKIADFGSWITNKFS